MTEQELITKQQLEIEELKQETEKLKKQMRNIYNIIYGIGGPLNDNMAQFNERQRDYFHNIVKNIDTWLVFNDYKGVMQRGITMKDTKPLNRMKNGIEYLKEGEQLVHDIVYIFGGYEAFCRLVEENSIHAYESPELLRRVSDFVGYVDYTEIER